MGINASGEFINPRRNHVACKAGRLMFVNGGLSQNGEVLNDTWTFNFESKTWSFVYLYKQIPSLSHHAACAVFNNPDKIVDIGHGVKSKKEKVIYFLILILEFRRNLHFWRERG